MIKEIAIFTKHTHTYKLHITKSAFIKAIDQIDYEFDPTDESMWGLDTALIRQRDKSNIVNCHLQNI